MILFINFCDCPWWCWWLLLPLLGLLLGWLIWGRLKGRIAELEEDNAKLRSQIRGLESDLKDCSAKNAGIDSDIALLKGRIREYEAKEKREDLESGTALGIAGGIEGINVDEKDARRGEKEGSESGEDGSDAEGTGGDGMEGSESGEDGSDAEDALGSSSTGDSEAGSGISAGAAGTLGSSTALGAMSSVGSSHSKSKNIYAVLKPDNLQVVEGIGPKMNEILNNNGVNNWSQLSDKSSSDLRNLLDSINPKRYRIIDPSSWPKQAKLAHAGDWEGLIKMQKNLDSGRAAGATGPTDSKVEKLLIKMGVLKRWKQDDLTAVEGIGPKISQLLHSSGITTWRELANAEVSRIQSILDAAGKRYKLADPGSWPKQAEMAAEGRWDDLEEYQDFLQGGK